jgi:hypothetical protein
MDMTPAGGSHGNSQRAVRKTGLAEVIQIKIRWGDLGSPTQPGKYPHGPHMVEVTPGDIQIAKGNPDAVFIAIHPDFYSDETPYLLTGIDLPENTTKTWRQNN